MHPICPECNLSKRASWLGSKVFSWSYTPVHESTECDKHILPEKGVCVFWENDLGTVEQMKVP